MIFAYSKNVANQSGDVPSRVTCHTHGTAQNRRGSGDRAMSSSSRRVFRPTITPTLRMLGDDGCETGAKADGLESWSNRLSTQNHLIAILQKSAFFSRFE